MGALLYKDLLSLKLYAKSMIMVVVIFGITSSTMATNGFGSFMSSVLVVVAMMATVTTFSYDEYNKWDNYVLSLPISRSKLVLSKYIFALITMVMGSIVSLLFIGVTSLFNGSFDVVSSSISAAVGGGAGIFMISFMLPIIYKLGANKGRILMMCGCVIPVILVSFFFRLNGFPSITEGDIMTIVKMLPFALVIFFILSCLLSIKIVKNKEY